MKKVKRMSKINKAILASLSLMAVTNPWSVGYIDYAIEVATKYFVAYSFYGFAVGIGGLILVNVIMMIQSRDRVNIPNKTARTKKAGKFVS